jgi:hypothetical protein
VQGGALTERWNQRKRKRKSRVTRDTYSNTGRNKVTLVQDKHKMLVGRFFPDVFFNTPTTSPFRITSVQNVDHNVRRIDNFVQFVPYSLTLAL